MYEGDLSEEEDQLEEEIQKLNDLREEYQDSERYLELNQEMREAIEGELSEVVEEENRYQDDVKLYEELLGALEQEINQENYQQNEAEQNINVANQQVQQDMVDEKQEQQNAEEHKQEKSNANQKIQDLNSQINDTNQKIAELDENEQIIEDAKREEEERRKQMQGFFGFLAAIVSIFCPITAALVGLVGQLVTNGDYESALKKVASEKLNEDGRKQEQEDLFQRQKELENVSEEKFQRALKSAQSKSSSILKGLNTKKDAENRLNGLKQSMENKQKQIFDLTQQKLSCNTVISNIKSKHQELIPKLEELNIKSTKICLPDIAQKLMKQQQVVKNLQQNVSMKKEKQAQERQRNNYC